MEKKILIVDDDRLVLKTVRLVCEKQGYVSVIASNAEEAVMLSKDLDLKLIICDIRMPGTDGIALIKKIRDARRIEGQEGCVPVIFITGYASESAPIEALNLGAVAYLLKPFNIDELLAAIRKVVA